MIIPILFHVLFLGGYGLWVFALLWYYRKYSLPRDPGRWVVESFLVISVLVAVAATVLLFYVPWGNLTGGLSARPLTLPSY